MSMRQRLKHFTPRTLFLTFYLSLAALNFGYDVGSFSGVQAMPAYRRRFGSFDPVREGYYLESYLSSLMNSTPMLGKLLGALICGPVTERFGRRPTMIILAFLSIICCVLQTASRAPAQFIIGRIINYGMIGFVIILVPIYQAECFPPALRGIVTSTIQFQISIGGLTASLVNLGTKGMATDAAWLIPTGLQLILPLVILAMIPWMPESPLWLISKGRKEQAVVSLSKLREKGTSQSDLEAEVLLLSSFGNNDGKGSWKEVFNKQNRRRTLICVATMFFQQATGQSFVSQYGIVFFQQNGVKNPFVIGVVQQVITIVCVFLAAVAVDSAGRRMVLFCGVGGMAISIYVLGGVGTVSPITDSLRDLLVACILLFGGFSSLSWGPVAYIIIGESAATRVKEKTNSMAVAISVCTTFVVSFTVPYLINPPYANLGAKVGFIYGSICMVSLITAYLLIPEMKGRSLEEIDQLFAAKVPAWRSSKFQTTRSTVEDLHLEKPVEDEVGDKDATTVSATNMGEHKH